MTFRGRVKKGIIVPDEPVTLAEGAKVWVAVEIPLPPQPKEPSPDEPTVSKGLLALAGKVKWGPLDPATAAEGRADLFWLADNPERSNRSKYHDAGACWVLIDVAIEEIRRLRQELAALRPSPQ